MRIIESINKALSAALENVPEVIILGEDILDPVGGAFRATKGLSGRFPERVITTPISESAIIGAASGLALRGFRPVAEIMFGDFLMLAADQLLNGVAKFQWMYNDKVKTPLVVRTPMGGYRGYGPTHSQSLEKHFMGLRGMDIVAISQAHDCGKLLYHAITKTEKPVLFIENKITYALTSLVDEEPNLWSLETGTGDYPTARLTLKGGGASSISLVTYGGMVPMCMEAAEKLCLDDEIFCEIIVPSMLQPLPMGDIAPKVRQTGRLLTVEEGSVTAGVGSEIIAAIAEDAGGGFRMRCKRVGAKDSFIPCSREQEKLVLPSADDIVSTARLLMEI